MLKKILVKSFKTLLLFSLFFIHSFLQANASFLEIKNNPVDIGIDLGEKSNSKIDLAIGEMKCNATKPDSRVGGKYNSSLAKGALVFLGITCEAVAEMGELCDGQTATLDGSNSVGVGTISYNWTTINGNIFSGANTAMPEVDSDGTYVLEIIGGDACVSTDTIEVVIDPLEMTLLSTIPSASGLNDIWGYTAPNGEEYVLLGKTDGVSIVSILDPANPIEVEFIPGVSTTWRDLKAWDQYAYVVNESNVGGGLLIIDMSGITPDPATSNISTTNSALGVNYTDSHNIYIDEFGKGYLFGATCTGNLPGATTNRGTVIIDCAANPANPPYIGFYPRYNVIGGRDTYVHDGYARGDTMWTSHIYDGTFGAVDVSGLASLPNGVITANEVLALQATPGDFTHACWLSEDGNTLAVVDEVGGNDGLGINTYDVSDLNNIIYLDNYESFAGTNVTPHNVFVKGNYIVASYYTSGVVIVDFSDPSNLVEVEHYDTSPNSGGGYSGCWGVYPYFPSGTIVASDRQMGLHVFEADCNPASRIEGTVTDSQTGNPISGASIDVLTYSNEEATTNILGAYSTGISYCGIYEVVFSAPCYGADTISVQFVNNTTIVLDAALDYNCCPNPIADAGDLTEPTGLAVIIEICEGDDLAAFGTSYTDPSENDPGAGHDYAYVLSQNNPPNYTIISSNTSGDFNTTTLSTGSYLVWGLSYDLLNTNPSVSSYLSGFVEVQQIQQDISNNGVCADIDRLNVDNKEMLFEVLAKPATPAISANGPTTFCQGNTVVLTSSIGSIGSSYLWSNGSSSQSIIVNASGNYSVQISNVSGCFSNQSNIISVNVNPLPATPTISANGPTNFCEGSNVMLSSDAPSNNLWSDGSSSQSVMVATSGNYSVQVIDANSCASQESNIINVTVDSDPDASFNILNTNYCTQDGPINLVPTTSGGVFNGTGVSGNTFDPSMVPSAMWGNPITISYSLTIGTCSSVVDQQVIVENCVTPGLQLELKVILEGAYEQNLSGMKTDLLFYNLIPLNQPYNAAPYNYSGTETVSGAFPTNAVDWVLVEIRYGTPNLTGSYGTVLVESKAGLLLSDGSLVGADGISDLTFNNLSSGTDYHILVRHRNHLDVISSSPITAAAQMFYDFTQNQNSAFASQQLKNIDTGLYGMYAGDFISDASIQVTDYDFWKLSPSTLYTYSQRDGNMDGVVQTTDYDVWYDNKAKLGPFEVR